MEMRDLRQQKDQTQDPLAQTFQEASDSTYEKEAKIRQLEYEKRLLEREKAAAAATLCQEKQRLEDEVRSPRADDRFRDEDDPRA